MNAEARCGKGPDQLPRDRVAGEKAAEADDVDVIVRLRLLVSEIGHLRGVIFRRFRMVASVAVKKTGDSSRKVLYPQVSGYRKPKEELGLDHFEGRGGQTPHGDPERIERPPVRLGRRNLRPEDAPVEGLIQREQPKRRHVQPHCDEDERGELGVSFQKGCRFVRRTIHRPRRRNGLCYWSHPLRPFLRTPIHKRDHAKIRGGRQDMNCRPRPPAALRLFLDRNALPR